MTYSRSLKHRHTSVGTAWFFALSILFAPFSSIQASTTWTVTEPYNSGGVAEASGEYASVAIGPDGLPSVSYYANEDNYATALWYAKCTTPECFETSIQEVEYTLPSEPGGYDKIGEFNDLAIGSDGLARIAYYDHQNDDLVLTRCLEEGSCTVSPSGIGTGNRTIVLEDMGAQLAAKQITLELDENDLPTILYGQSNQFQYIRCLDLDCTSKATNTILSRGIDYLLTPSMAFNNEGIARIAYLDDEFRIQLILCANADCSSSTTQSDFYDMANDAWMYQYHKPHFTSTLAMATDEDGMVRLMHSYMGMDEDWAVDTYLYRLNHIQCGDDGCTPGNIHTEMLEEEFGYVDGRQLQNPRKALAMEVAPDNTSRVSYQLEAMSGFTPRSVNMIRCNDPSCSDFDDVVAVDPNSEQPAFPIYTDIGVQNNGRAVIIYRAGYLNSLNAGYIRIAVEPDNGPPTVPGPPQVNNDPTNSPPVWTWTESTDEYVMGDPPYIVEWSDSNNFDSNVGSDTSPANSYAHSQNLSDGVWYFRVKAVDASGNESDWSETGSITIDTTAPTVPGIPSVTSPPNDNIPGWEWVAASDSGTGLADPAYTLEWSQDSDFEVVLGSSTTNMNSFTHAAPMTDGTWYARVKAVDTVGNESDWSETGSVTIDTSAPIVDAFTPASGSSYVSIDAKLFMQFSETVVTKEGDIVIYRAFDDSVVETFTVDGESVSGSGTNTITIDPLSDLEYDTQYYVLIDEGAITDTSGNEFAGMSDKTIWYFTTDAEPATVNPGEDGGGDNNSEKPSKEPRSNSPLPASNVTPTFVTTADTSSEPLTINNTSPQTATTQDVDTEDDFENDITTTDQTVNNVSPSIVDSQQGVDDSEGSGNRSALFWVMAISAPIVTIWSVKAAIFNR